MRQYDGEEILIAKYIDCFMNTNEKTLFNIDNYKTLAILSEYS